MKSSPPKLVSGKVAKKPVLKTDYILKCPEGRTVLCSLDPGSKNFGLSVFEVTIKHGIIAKIELLEARKLVNTIYDPKDKLIDKQQAFSLEIRRLINRHKPKHIMLERFLSRGRGGAMTAETTNHSIGTVLEIARAKKIPVSIVLAVSWKARTKRMFFYRFKGKRPGKKDTALDHLYQNNKKVPHIIDAFMIGMYFIDAYDYLNVPDNLNRLIGKLSGK